MLSKIIGSVVLSFITNVALGQAVVTKSDFAYGSEIEITNKNSVIEFPITDDVYKTVQNNNLKDVAVYNSKNEIVPHMLATPSTKTVDILKPAVDIAAFPINGNSSLPEGLNNIQIETFRDGTIVKVKSTDSKDKINSDTLIGYLLDTTQIKEPLNEFEVPIENFKNNYFVKLNIEGSQDLKIWTPVTSDAVLANFEVNNEKIIKNKIPLNGARFAYFRISWEGSSEKPQIQTVKGLFGTEKETVAEPFNWIPLTEKKLEDATTHQTFYHFDLGGFYPIAAIKVNFVDQNSVATIKIESASHENGPWVFQQMATFFSISKDGSELSNLATYFPENKSRFWRMQLNSNAAGIGSHFPTVTFGWKPNYIRFLARGEPPFTFAYGSSKIINTSSSDLISADWAKDVGSGILKGKISLGGTEKLIVEEKSDYPFKKIVLWVFLVFGVILLASMAVQIKKQMPPI